MTDDAWFGVTPEPVAKYVYARTQSLCSQCSRSDADPACLYSQIASDMYGTDASKTTLIDMFGGAGGNTIAFALSERWEHVISIEKDAATLACAQANAEIYGVDESYISWIHGDSFEFLDALINRPESLHPDLRVDVGKTVIFASPPWGGPGYKTAQIFDLHTMQPYNLHQLHTAAGNMDHALYLPRTSDIRQLAKLVPDGHKIDVVQYCIMGASKAMVAYFPGEYPSNSAT